jgi:hypothetical protein
MELTPAHLSLAQETMSRAIDTLMTMGSPFPALAMAEKGGARSMHRFMHERVEESVAAARQYCVTRDDADCVAFAADSFIAFDGTRLDAIVVETWDYRTETVARHALRYRMTGMFRKKPELIGTPLEFTSSGWIDPD